jgi:hypothetical protein
MVMESCWRDTGSLEAQGEQSLLDKDHVEHSDSNAADDPSRKEHCRILGTGLEICPQYEHNYSNRHAIFSRYLVCKVSVE